MGYLVYLVLHLVDAGFLVELLLEIVARVLKHVPQLPVLVVDLVHSIYNTVEWVTACKFKQRQAGEHEQGPLLHID